MSYPFKKPKDMSESHLCRTVAYNANDNITDKRKNKCRKELMKRWSKQFNIEEPHSEQFKKRTTWINNESPRMVHDIVKSFINK